MQLHIVPCPSSRSALDCTSRGPEAELCRELILQLLRKVLVGTWFLWYPGRGLRGPEGLGHSPVPHRAGPGAWEECPYGSSLGTFLALLRPEKAEHFQVTDPRPQHRSATRTLRPGEEKRLARCHWGSMAGPAPVGLPQESKACGTSLGSGTL